MHDYLLESELVRFAFVLGIVVAVLFYDRLHLSTGSVVVPGYIGICILTPSWILGTVASALIVYFFLNYVLPRFVFMSKTEKFLAAVLLSVAFQAGVFELRLMSNELWSRSYLMTGIGYVIPGLIAHDMSRQRIARTILALAGAGGIVAAAVLCFVFLAPDLARAASNPEPSGHLSFDLRWMPVALLLSALASCALRRNHSLKSGGFLGAAYLSLILVQPMQILSLLVLTLATHWIVTRILMQHLILFGRRKFASMLLVGTALSWAALLWTRQSGFWELEASSSSALTLAGVLLCGLYANDLERIGASRLAEGTIVAVLFTLSGTLIAVELGGQARPEVILVLGLVAAASGSFILAPQLRAAVRSLWQGSVEPALLAENPPPVSHLRPGPANGWYKLVGGFLILALALGAGFLSWRKEAALFDASRRATHAFTSYGDPDSRAPAPEPIRPASAGTEPESTKILAGLHVAPLEVNE